MPGSFFYHSSRMVLISLPCYQVRHAFTSHSKWCDSDGHWRVYDFTVPMLRIGYYNPQWRNDLIERWNA